MDGYIQYRNIGEEFSRNLFLLRYVKIVRSKISFWLRTVHSFRFPYWRAGGIKYLPTKFWKILYIQVAAGSNQLFTGSIDGVDNIFSEKLWLLFSKANKLKINVN